MLVSYDMWYPIDIPYVLVTLLQDLMYFMKVYIYMWVCTFYFYTCSACTATVGLCKSGWYGWLSCCESFSVSLLLERVLN